jgi:hypothetical protein
MTDSKSFKRALWGTGATASLVVRHVEADFDVAIDRHSTETFLGIPTIHPDAVTHRTFSSLTIASMFYPEILSNLRRKGLQNIPLKVFTGHLINPQFLLTEVPLQTAWAHCESFEAGPGRQEKQLKSLLERERVDVRTFSNRFEHLASALSLSPQGGLALEFGVHQGHSLRFLRQQSDREVIGFDSLAGFHEQSQFAGWLFHAPVGGILDEELVALRSDPLMRVGYFEDTLQEFLNESMFDIDFVHYDAADRRACDFVLRLVLPRLTEGAVIVFDDLIPHQSDLESAELRSLIEVSEELGFHFQILSWVPGGTQVAVKFFRNKAKRPSEVRGQPFP